MEENRQLKNGQLTVTVLKNGALASIKAGKTMINQVNGNQLDGSLMNIYLRVFSAGQVKFFIPLLGPEAASKLKIGNNQASWTGSVNGLNYQVELLLASHVWFWTVDLSSESAYQADLTYVQDLGLGESSFVESNEAYASQYIDHLVIKEAETITVCSRQNQSQSGKYPYLQQGAFGALKSYSTDGFQFYGTAYKQTNIPLAMKQADLANQKYQYEFALTALRTPRFQVSLQTARKTFYAAFLPDQPSDNQQKLFTVEQLRCEYEKLIKTKSEQDWTTQSPLQLKNSVLSGRQLTDAELQQLFPLEQRKQAEISSGQLLSFFDQQRHHIVLPEKEIRQERMTGNVIMSYAKVEAGQPVLATTQYMCGIFASQTVFGNTNLNILSTNTRNALNVFKASGMRIWLKIAGTWKILTMPSLFCMSYEGADWYYKLADDLLKVSVEAAASGDGLLFEVESAQQREYDLRVVTQLDLQTLGKGLQLLNQNGSLTVLPAQDSLMAKRCPKLKYYYNFTDQQQVEITDWGSETEKYLVFEYHSAQKIKFTLTTLAAKADFEIVKQRAANENKLIDFLGNLKLQAAQAPVAEYLQQTDLIIPWFVHDALVHLLSPHGLEQYGGAAWGTRDVSQGPTELLLSLGHFDQVKKIILMIYQHQFIENGSWPQWFMFDEYADQFADESHGDIVIWPLKVVADYLEKTHDEAILDHELPFFSLQAKRPTTRTASLASHLQDQLNYLQTNFLFDTQVSSYGDGDWDDTLQPANSEQKKTMASTWTMELTIGALNTLVQSLHDHPRLKQNVQSMVNGMERDFKKYFMQDDVLPGFIQMNQQHQVKPIIHPNDRTTGIAYRLLPLQQGILSNIFSPKQINRALQLIKDNLAFPDGVRLMNRPAAYTGGVSHIFKRAEQSACFGREIGLMYTHAHIRYAEALAAVQLDDQAWEALMKVNPINLQQRVKNAALRQANTYFSSSDGDFADRYAAAANFDKLKTGAATVKGGWRLYSSGPGIYVAVLQKLLNKNV